MLLQPILMSYHGDDPRETHPAGRALDPWCCCKQSGSFRAPTSITTPLAASKPTTANGYFPSINPRPRFSKGCTGFYGSNQGYPFGHG
ncbi:hypothetical protein ACSQ67_024492 [Phaseolus vulgaris]